MANEKISRKQSILQSLATMLEATPGGRITTAALAAEVGVSEAALYRHFPSKTRMYEGLIDFIEDTLFTRIRTILDEEPRMAMRCQRILSLLLTFAERNPGITRLINGDALTGETERLHRRIQQLFDRLETQLKQILREGEMGEGIKLTTTPTNAANFMLSAAEGRISQFVRSEFKRPPMEHWPEQWQLLYGALTTPQAAQ